MKNLMLNNIALQESKNRIMRITYLLIGLFIFSIHGYACSENSDDDSYNYNEVCNFIDAQLSIVGKKIEKDKYKHSALVSHGNSTVKEYKYSNEKMSAEFIVTESKKIIVWVHFPAYMLSKNNLSKYYFLKKFGIDHYKKSDMSLGCDAETLNMHFSGDTLKYAEISANFID